MSTEAWKVTFGCRSPAVPAHDWRHSTAAVCSLSEK
jgi:hypothetical protein